MRKQYWKQIMKVSGVAIVLSLILSVALTPIDFGQQEVYASSPKPVRTDVIFNTDAYKDKFTIRYFHLTGDVSMGDSIFIQTPEGKTMLVDAGLPEAGPKIVEYLNKLGVNTIDIAVNTHPHTDHIGGFSTVARDKEIKQFYMENLPYPASKSYTNAMAAINNKRIPITYIERGSSFKLGEDVTVEVLSPPKGVLPGAVKTFDAAEINFYSLVLKLNYKDQSYLLSGDIYRDREDELIKLYGSKLQSDFMHAPHHGSTTSSGLDYINTVKPKVSVISNNIYSNNVIMKRYDRSKVKIVATRFHGNILVVADGKNQMDLITENDWDAPRGLLIYQ